MSQERERLPEGSEDAQDEEREAEETQSDALSGFGEPETSKVQEEALKTLGARTGGLERYEILDELGQGGFGVVYKARQLATGQLVAIKQLLIDEFSNKKTRHEHIARFKREMSLIASLRDPNIVRLMDSGFTDEGQPFMVLEFIEGRELDDLIKEQGALSPAAVKRLMTQVARGLAEAHDHGIVHRDLKPANIMVVGEGRRASAKVLDFGIAGIQEEKKEADAEGITVAGQIRGTPYYMAPEQLRLFGEARPETDVYALGLIMFECLSAQRAVIGESMTEICVKQIKEELVLPKEIEESAFGPIIKTCVQKDPEKRFSTAAELLEVLDAIEVTGELSGLTGSKAVDKLLEAAGKTKTVTGGLEIKTGNLDEAAKAIAEEGRRTRRMLLGIGLVLVLGLLVGGLFMFQESQQPKEGPAQAQKGTSPEEKELLESLARGLVWETKEAAVTATVTGARFVPPTPEEVKIAEYMMKARVARKEKRYEDAIRAYDAVLAINPEYYDALKGKGWTFIDLGDLKLAAIWLARAFYFNPGAFEADPQAHLLLATAYEGSGQLLKAVVLYDAFLSRFPDNKDFAAELNLAKMQLLNLKSDLKEQGLLPDELPEVTPALVESEASTPDEPVVKDPKPGEAPKDPPPEEKPEETNPEEVKPKKKPRKKKPKEKKPEVKRPEEFD